VEDLNMELRNSGRGKTRKHLVGKNKTRVKSAKKPPLGGSRMALDGMRQIEERTAT
jgi:hypothetical protein